MGITQPSPEEQTQRAQDEAQGVWQKAWNQVVLDPENWPEIATVVLAAFAVGFAWKAYTANRDQAGSARGQLAEMRTQFAIQNRAFLVPTWKGSWNVPPHESQRTADVNIQLHVKNTGNTPARLRFVRLIRAGAIGKDIVHRFNERILPTDELEAVQVSFPLHRDESGINLFGEITYSTGFELVRRRIAYNAARVGNGPEVDFRHTSGGNNEEPADEKELES